MTIPLEMNVQKNMSKPGRHMTITSVHETYQTYVRLVVIYPPTLEALSWSDHPSLVSGWLWLLGICDLERGDVTTSRAATSIGSPQGLRLALEW